MDLDGLFYCPCAHFEIGGTGVDLGSQIIAYTVHVFGTGLALSWDSGFPSGRAEVYLIQ